MTIKFNTELLLIDKESFNAFSKILHDRLNSNPNYKVTPSWNALSAEIAVALLTSHNVETKTEPNINTLNQIYKEQSNSKIVNIYQTITSSIFKGLIRDYSHQISEAIAEIEDTGDMDIYNRAVDLTEGEIRKDLVSSLKTLYHPADELFEERKPLMQEYSFKANPEHFEHYKKLFIQESDYQFGAQYVFFLTAYYTLQELTNDLFMTYLNDFAETMTDKDTRHDFLMQSPSKINEQLWKFLDDKYDDYVYYITK